MWVVRPSRGAHLLPPQPDPHAVVVCIQTDRLCDACRKQHAVSLRKKQSPGARACPAPALRYAACRCSLQSHARPHAAAAAAAAAALAAQQQPPQAGSLSSKTAANSCSWTAAQQLQRDSHRSRQSRRRTLLLAAQAASGAPAQALQQLVPHIGCWDGCVNCGHLPRASSREGECGWSRRRWVEGM